MDLRNVHLPRAKVLPHILLQVFDPQERYVLIFQQVLTGEPSLPIFDLSHGHLALVDLCKQLMISGLLPLFEYGGSGERIFAVRGIQPLPGA